ncbi:hypothetical protein L7F22_062466 [Adiantum nelumboides]|nr:hypothetical protein [Adiantum nelumboides]
MAALAGPCLASDALEQATSLAAELCKQFYGLGWVSGTGGSISLKELETGEIGVSRSSPMPAFSAAEPLRAAFFSQSSTMRSAFFSSPQIFSHPFRSAFSAAKALRAAFFSQSSTIRCVPKERMLPEDMYILDADGNILSAPSPKPAPHRPPKCSECAPLFMKAYKMRKAGAVIHSHGMESCLATMINPAAKEFRMRAYPKSTAVLVRNHGIYVWGDSWITAKTQAECYHYLFDAALRLHNLGLDPTDPKHGPLKTVRAAPSDSFSNGTVLDNETHATVSKGLSSPQSPNPLVVVLDIEGTTTPISFVTEILFPYARSNVRNHLESTYESEETQADINLLRKQAEQDVKDGVSGAQLIPSTDGDRDKIIAAVEANVISMIKADRKVTALKELQGHIWRSGYMKGELQGKVFEDVPKALSEWHAAGAKVYIYSSGSREAQRLIFGNTQYGDLRPFLCGYFDTFIGVCQERWEKK